VKFFTVSLALALLAACSNTPEPPASGRSPAAPPAGTSAVRGKVVVDGTVPAATMIRIDGDPKCVALAQASSRPAEYVVIGDGQSLQNVFVYVKDGLPPRMYPVPSEAVVLDQQQCRYVPRVLGVQVGQQLTIRNSDPLLHNVRAEGAVNAAFDVGTPVQGMETRRTFATREVMVPIKCNVHGWMTAFIGVLEHPYFDVTDQAGQFSIERLPPGTYTLEVWHERFGTQTQQVTVGTNDSQDLTFTFKAT
jgi:plastocyanin